jgi:hypothetical protein
MVYLIQIQLGVVRQKAPAGYSSGLVKRVYAVVNSDKYTHVIALIRW